MATKTFSSSGSKTWTVPDGNSKVILRVWGGGGGDGDGGGGNGEDETRNISGGNGGYAEGTLSVNSGDTLYIYVGGGGGSGSWNDGGWPNGADGQYSEAHWSYYDSTGAETWSGGGGGSTDVRHNNDSQGSRVISAGGGGGGAGAAINISGDSAGHIDAGGSGDGGGSGQGGGSASAGGADAGGGSGEASSDWNGLTGSTNNSYGSGGYAAAAGGSGGGGYTGGGGGGADTQQGGTDSYVNSAAGGSGGGGGDTPGVYNANVTVGGGSSGSGKVEIQYSEPVDDLSASSDVEDEATLSWTDTGGESGHNILRAEASGSSVGDYAQIDSVGAGVTSYPDTGREDGEEYFYRLETTYTDTDNVLSNEASVVVFVPAASSLNATTNGADSVDLDWTREDDSPDGVWEVYRSLDGGLGTLQTTISDVSTTQWTDTDVSGGETYTYTVRRQTDHTSADTTTTASILAPPYNIRVTAVSGNDVTVAWDHDGDDDVEDGFRVYWSRDDGLSWTQGPDLAADSREHTATGLPDGEQVRFAVAAFKDDGSERITAPGLYSP